MPEDFRLIEKYCENCGKKLQLNNTRDIERKRFCSRKCGAEFRWKEKIFYGISPTQETREKMKQSKLRLMEKGWKPNSWLKYLPKRRLSGRGYYFWGHKREHQVLIEEKIGRKLLPNEVIHHIDENKLNNSLENLCVMTRSEHAKLHIKLRRENYAPRSV